MIKVARGIDKVVERVFGFIPFTPLFNTPVRRQLLRRGHCVPYRRAARANPALVRPPTAVRRLIALWAGSSKSACAGATGRMQASARS